MNGDYFTLKMLLEDMGRKDLQNATITTPNKILKFQSKGTNQKVSFDTHIMSILTGTSVISFANNYSEKLTQAINEPEKFIHYIGLFPLKYFEEFTRTGNQTHNESKINDYKIGTLVNAQIVQQIYNSQNNKQIPIITTATTSKGNKFFKSIGFQNTDKLWKEGVTLEELYYKSINAAIKTGFDL